MKGVAIHGVLALVGLVLAYTTWARDESEEVAEGSVTLVDCDPDEVKILTYENESRRTSLSSEGSGSGRRYWLTNQDVAKPKQGPKEGSDGKGKEPLKPFGADAKPDRFLTNKTFKDYLKRVAPLRAVRSLGVLSKEQAEELAFDNIKTSFALGCGGQSRSFELGKTTYGSNRRYLRDPKSGAVFLVDGSVMNDLRAARSRFMQNTLHRFEMKEVETATVSVADKTRTLKQRDRKSRKQALWVDAAAPDKLNVLYDNWFERLGRLSVKKYLGQGKKPGADLTSSGLGAPQPVVSVEYTVEGKEPGKLELVKVQEAGQARYYARSELTVDWVRLMDSTAGQVEQDAAQVAGEQPEG